MKNRLVGVCLVLILAFATVRVGQADVVVPGSYAGTTGTGTFLGPFVTTGRTYQLLIHEDQLASVVGQNLNGVQWRLPASATADWPASSITYNNFDIRLSEGVTPSARSLTFADNVVGTQTLVRSGSLTIPASSFTFGGSPNSFGMNIAFDNYLYTGGHLLFEIRQDGFTGTSRSVDALTTSTSGYSTQFSAAWNGSYTATTGSQGNFSVIQFSTSPVPEPGTLFGLVAIGLGSVLVSRRRAG